MRSVSGIAGLVNVLDPELDRGGRWSGDGGRPAARARTRRVPPLGGRGRSPSRCADRGSGARHRRRRDRGRRAGVRSRGSHPRVRLGISLPVFTADPSRPFDVASRARSLGVDGVFAPDHLFPPVFYPPSGADRPALEVFSLLSAIAVREPGLHVGTLVTRVTLRSPGLLAKQAAALDAMSQRAGRARHRHRRPGLGRGTRTVRLPVPARSRTPRDARGDRRCVTGTVRRAHMAGRARTCRR